MSVTSSEPVTYQWSRSGVPIDGATDASYALQATQLTDSGARFTVTAANSAGAVVSDAAGLTVDAVVSSGASAQRLFSDRSLWNARPTRFTLGAYVIPASSYFPTITTGQYSVSAAIASNADPAVTVVANAGQPGVWVPDAETFASQVTIPHWPAGTAPATGSDGHADIIDAASNRIHSFWQLNRDAGGQWHAAQYTWTPLDGSGWGTPADYMQGTRAVGVVSIAGVIRKSEVDDGEPIYHHALAMSLTDNALSAATPYAFPATASDSDAASSNTGQIPEGARMMIPASFDLSTITDARLRKIVKTLQTYGAYVVDRNTGTPYVIYVENGSNFDLMPNGWDNGIAAQLETIHAALRQVVTVSEWVDANGAVFTPAQDLNLLSMRGSWYLLGGTTAGTFDSWRQAVVFADDGRQTTQINSGGRSMPSVAWAAPQPGRNYQLVATATGGATLRFELRSNGATVYASGAMIDGATVDFTWPAGNVTPAVTVVSGPQGGGSISATLVRTP